MENTEIIQVPVKPQKEENKLKRDTDNRRQEILKLVKLAGLGNTKRRAKSLAEQYKVSFQTIYKDIDWIIGHYEPEDLRRAKIDMRIGRERAIQEALELINSSEGKEKAQAIQTLNQTLKMYREELEAWGEKTKIADKQDVNITGYQFELIRTEKPKVLSN
jgi:hypothetical protein